MDPITNKVALGKENLKDIHWNYATNKGGRFYFKAELNKEQLFEVYEQVTGEKLSCFSKIELFLVDEENMKPELVLEVGGDEYSSVNSEYVEFFNQFFGKRNWEVFLEFIMELKKPINIKELHSSNAYGPGLETPCAYWELYLPNRFDELWVLANMSRVKRLHLLKHASLQKPLRLTFWWWKEKDVSGFPLYLELASPSGTYTTGNRFDKPVFDAMFGAHTWELFLQAKAAEMGLAVN